MNVILTVIIGSLMVALGYYERGYWAFGGEAIIELACRSSERWNRIPGTHQACVLNAESLMTTRKRIIAQFAVKRSRWATNCVMTVKMKSER